MLKMFSAWLFFCLHPFYVSVCSIEQSKDKTNLEVSCRIFYDDLEAALKNTYGGKIDLKDAKQSERNNGLLQKYFKRNFQVKLNGNTIEIKYLGFNIEGEAAWCFLEIKNVKNIKSMDVSNRLLYESFKEQIHIFHVNIGGEKKSTKIQNPDFGAKFKF